MMHVDLIRRARLSSRALLPISKTMYQRKKLRYAPHSLRSSLVGYD